MRFDKNSPLMWINITFQVLLILLFMLLSFMFMFLYNRKKRFSRQFFIVTFSLALIIKTFYIIFEMIHPFITNDFQAFKRVDGTLFSLYFFTDLFLLFSLSFLIPYWTETLHELKSKETFVRLKWIYIFNFVSFAIFFLLELVFCGLYFWKEYIFSIVQGVFIIFQALHFFIGYSFILRYFLITEWVQYERETKIIFISFYIVYFSVIFGNIIVLLHQIMLDLYYSYTITFSLINNFLIIFGEILPVCIITIFIHKTLKEIQNVDSWTSDLNEYNSLFSKN